MVKVPPHRPCLGEEICLEATSSNCLHQGQQGSGTIRFACLEDRSGRLASKKLTGAPGGTETSEKIKLFRQVTAWG